MAGAALFLAATASAQQIPTGYQEYFVLGNEQHVWYLLNRVITGEGGGYTAGNGMNSVVSAVASADGQRLSYDHWEDGLEADILSPTQASTWILGDGNAANGDVCLWTTTACTADFITAGMDITLDSKQGLLGLEACPTTGAAQIRCSVPLNSRRPAGLSVTSVTLAGAVATVTTPAAHGWASGLLVTISGATQPEYNGTFAIAVTGANTFTYTVQGSPASPATGVITRVEFIRFDGGDRIVSSGGPVSFVHNQDPKCTAGCPTTNMTIIGGATEVLSKQAFQNATSYSVPVGENLWTANGTPTEPFQYVGIDLVAFEDGTNVVINSPGSGTLSLVLNRGEHFTNCDTWTVAARNPCLTGQIDGPTRSVNVTPTVAVNAGTKISTTAPVSALMFAAGDQTFATHFMPLLPDLLHGSDYLIPSVGDYQAACPDPPCAAASAPQADSRPTQHYLFNPDPDNSIVVRYTDTTGTGTTTIAPNSTINYCTATGRALPNCVPANSTVRLTSDRRFWGVTIHDHIGVLSDWSYAWLATRFLSTSYTSAYSPGTRQATNCPGGANPPCDSYNRAPVWVSATQDNTYVRIDLDGDGSPNFVDRNGDGCPDASINTTPTDVTCQYIVAAGCTAPAAGRCVYEVDTLQSLRVYDYTDLANTGTRISANKPVAMVYGQDPEQGVSGDETPDTGYVIYPALQAFLNPVFTLDKDVDTTNVPTAGGIANYTLTVRSYDFGPLTEVTVFDLLPAPVVLGDNPYVIGTTLVTYPDLYQATADPTIDTDPVTGRVRLTWDLRRSPPTPYSMNANETLTIRYSIRLPAAPGGAPRILTNQAHASALYGGSSFRPTDTADVVQTDAVLFKASADDGSPQPGDVITYTLYVRNLGAVNETGVIVTDAVPPDTTFVTGSITDVGTPFAGTGTWLSTANAIRWGGAGGVTVGPGAGTAVSVSSITHAGTVAYGTTAAAHNWASGVPVTISGAVPAAYNGVFTVTVTGPTTFTYTMLSDPGSNASGTITATGPYRLTFQVRINPGVPDGTFIRNRGGYESLQTPFFLSNEVRPMVVGPALAIAKTSDPQTVRSISSLTHLGSTAYATTTVAHGWISGEPVTIAGATPSIYNGSHAITVTGATTFTYTTASDPGSNASGTITATGPTVVAYPNQVLTFHVRVRNTGAGSASNVRIDDAIPANTTYVGGSMAYSLNAAAFTSLTDAGDLDQGTVPAAFTVNTITNAAGVATATTALAHGFAVGQTVQITGAQVAAYDGSFVITTVPSTVTFTFAVPAGTPNETAGGPVVTATRPRFVLASLGPGEDLDFRFQVRVNAGTAGLFVNNQASVSAVEAPATTDTNLVSIPIIGTVTVTGHVFLDLNGNGVDGGAGEPDIANVDVVVTDVDGNTQTVTTNATGDWSAVVPAGATRANVDETDPDFPPQATETTATDGTQWVAPHNWIVGYQQPPIIITKRSSAGGTVFPGQRVTYTVTVTNNTNPAVVQTQVNLADLLPAGMTYVPGTAGVVSATNSALRVTEYQVPAVCGGAYSGTACTATLAQPLAANYFAIIQGSADAANSLPSANYAALTNDFAGSGDFAGGLGANTQVTLTRGSTATNWAGVLTIVECIAANCATDPNGFRLLDVRRVSHGAGVLAGTNATTTPWVDMARVMLVGGANGAGCETASATLAEHQACHPRLWPSGTNTINWTRDAAGAVSLDAATSTVMVVQWGSAWGVQRSSILNGYAGGDAIDAPGEYNTTTIGPVPRAQTWVWGTGHSNDSNTGSSAEAVALTLGNGVARNATESRIAAGIDETGNAINFDVYALTHPLLAVDHRFQIEGNAGTSPVDVPVNAATANRMALVYNDLDDQTTGYPTPLLYGRYSSNTNVAVSRRQTAPAFAAWVQGIDFSQIREFSRICANTAATCYTPLPAPGPSNVILGSGAGANGITLATGATLTFTYQAVVDDPLDPSITSVSNTATVTTLEQPTPRSATATDIVARLTVDVEHDNAGYSRIGGTYTFAHVVTNLGSQDDSYDMRVTSLLGWKVELLNPITGSVIATDSNGDGVWDGAVTINTGTLTPTGTREYFLRVTVPSSGVLVGDQDRIRLTGTSLRNSLVSDTATDQLTVIADVNGTVQILPDNSGVVLAGGSKVYPHRIFNNTASPDTFDLGALSELSWTTTIYWDANGDGAYTEGVDQAISNSQLLGVGASQLIFIKVDCPAGTPDNARDVAHLIGVSRNNPDVFGAATDTTTVVEAGSHDLSGGGTRTVLPGVTTVHPGTVTSYFGTPQLLDMGLGPAALYGADGFNHPTELWIDTDANSVPDTLIATDGDGDGDWDVIAPGYDLYTNGVPGANGLPEVTVPANGQLAYELRRFVDGSQVLQRDSVTLTAIAPSDDRDSVTATWIIAAPTRGSLAGLRVDPAGRVEWVTEHQRGTGWFSIFATKDPAGREGRRLLGHARSPRPDSMTPIAYRLEAGPIPEPYIVIEETETKGTTRTLGPFLVGDLRLERSLVRALGRVGSGRQMRRRGLDDIRSTVQLSARPARTRPTSSRAPGDAPLEAVKVLSRGSGELAVSLRRLVEAGLVLAESMPLVVTRAGKRVSYTQAVGPDGAEIRFLVAPLLTDYTDRNVFVVSYASSSVPTMEVPLTVSGDPAPALGTTRVSKTTGYVADVPADWDPWLWDGLLSDMGPWPYPDVDPDAGSFDLPDLIGLAQHFVPVRVRVYGYTEHVHTVTARLNGLAVGQTTIVGRAKGLIEGRISQAALFVAGNQLSLEYAAAPMPGTPPEEPGGIFLDHLDLEIATRTPRIEPAAIEPFSPALPSLSNAQYLIVTHPDFADAAATIAQAKQGEGLSTAILTTAALYDRFSCGFVEAQAIRAGIRHAASTSDVLRFVLLIGDDTFDNNDFSGTGARSYVPSLLYLDGMSGRVPSESLFADLDDDGLPDLAMGRLPVQTPEQALAVAQKLVRQGEWLAAWPGQHLLAVDNSNPEDAPFAEDAAEMADLLPSGQSLSWARIADGADVARQALERTWGEGVSTVHYFGHAGPDLWADEHLLTTARVRQLGSTLKPALVLNWACSSGWFAALWDSSVNEELVLTPEGGALASFGPVGITSPAAQRMMYEALYPQLYRDRTIGEAIVTAKRSAGAAHPAARDAIEGFALLGDPALRLPRPSPDQVRHCSACAVR